MLAAYGGVSILSAVISKINIAAQPVEVAAAKEEEERLEEARIIAEYREKKANEIASEKSEDSKPAPLRRAVVRKQLKEDETDKKAE